MEHDVGVRPIIAAANETARLEVIGSARSPTQEPLRANDGLGANGLHACHHACACLRLSIINCPAADNNLSTSRPIAAAQRSAVLHATNPPVTQQQSTDGGVAHDCQVRAGKHAASVEIRHTGAAALAATDHSVEFGETFLLPTVNIIRQRISGLLHRFKKGAKKLIRGRTTLQSQRTSFTWKRNSKWVQLVLVK